MRNKIATIIILMLVLSITWIALMQESGQKAPPQIISIPKIEVPKTDIPKIDILEVTAIHKDDEFSNIVSNLKSVVEFKSSSDKLTESEMQNVLSKLRYLKPLELKKELPIKEISSIIKKTPIEKEEVIKVVKKIEPEIIKEISFISKPKIVEPINKEVYIDKPITIIEPTITTNEYRRRLKKDEEVDKDLMSLPMVRTVDMNIEQKIKRGEIEELRTAKPLLEKTTITVSSDEKKIDDDIPWAKLREVDEKVDGILLKKDIN